MQSDMSPNTRKPLVMTSPSPRGKDPLVPAKYKEKEFRIHCSGSSMPQNVLKLSTSQNKFVHSGGKCIKEGSEHHPSEYLLHSITGSCCCENGHGSEIPCSENVGEKVVPTGDDTATVPLLTNTMEHCGAFQQNFRYMGGNYFVTQSSRIWPQVGRDQEILLCALGRTNMKTLEEILCQHDRNCETRNG